MTLAELRQLRDAGNLQAAGDGAEELLRANPDDAGALFALSEVLFDCDRPAAALAVAEKVVRKAPEQPQGYMMVAASYAALEQHREALRWLDKALNRWPRHPGFARMMAHAQVGLYDFKAAEKWARRALEAEDHYQAHIALGYVHLHRREWGAGWDELRHGMGRMKWRDAHGYGLPEYDGAGTVLVYGEQGLGDQIAYCSALPAETVQVNCHPKLANLMRRSLGIEVHGDQFTEQIQWKPRADAQASMTEALRWTRRNAEDFPKVPYLKAHPEKALQWRALLDSLGDRPKVGLAWTGGVVGSAGWKSRNLAADDLAPLLDLPCEWVSLEYRDGPVPDGVHSFPWATQTDDLDDFAALVAGLDAVVCVPTTAYHVAGGLGVPAHVIVHETPHYHEGISGGCPWWGSVKFYRRPENGTRACVEAVCESLSALTRGNPSLTTSCSSASSGERHSR